MTDRRKVPRGIFVPVYLTVIGIVVFLNAAGKPGFETFRAIDIVRLIAVGMCFGAALVTLIVFFRGRRSN